MRSGTIKSLNTIDGDKSGVLEDTASGVRVAFHPTSVRNVGPGTTTPALTVGMSVLWECMYASNGNEPTGPASVVKPA